TTLLFSTLLIRIPPASFPGKNPVPASIQILAVGGDDLLVPVETVLAAARQGAVAHIVLVHIDEAIALAHLVGGGRDQVDGSPAGVAPHLDALVDGLAHLADVLAEVIDAVGVVDGAVRLD